MQDEIILVSGVTALTGRLTGKSQKILTEDDGRDVGEKLSDLLSLLVYKVGEIDLTTYTASEKKEFFNEMPSCDKQKLLIQIRQNSLNNEPSFDFEYEYVTKDKKVVKVPMVCDLSSGFPEKSMAKLTDNIFEGCVTLREMKSKLAELKSVSYSSYKDVLSDLEVTFTLPESRRKVVFTKLNGRGEKIGAAAEKLSSHTPLLMRNIRYFEPEKNVPIRFQAGDLDNLSFIDIEILRSVVYAVEGKLDTEYKYERPDSKLRPANDKYAIMNVVGEINFFFPSGAI